MIRLKAVLIFRVAFILIKSGKSTFQYDGFRDLVLDVKTQLATLQFGCALVSALCGEKRLFY